MVPLKYQMPIFLRSHLIGSWAFVGDYASNRDGSVSVEVI